ncbi:polyadenylated rna binding protein [Moniliophthora roreri]|uniref:Nab2 type CCCH zinc finger 4 domain-containing protein n=1 Tax=Moniliophthora roreri TaxID=221103 RepID=A0A0W0F123_MONRR|nr:polyadenylated rna binding protein [Moniliophthora roreri]
MPFGLTIGTERATALQQAIQDELLARGYSQDSDPVMAEYILIMIINNKTAAQITGELDDLIGADFDSSFTDWLFAEAAKGSSEAEPSAAPATTERPPEQVPAREAPSHPPRQSHSAPRNGVYQQALSQALPQTTSSHKRTASARSPSPHHPNKIRRTDVPTGPRAMQREGPSNSRSLLDRVGGPSHHTNGGGPHDDIQARIDNITNNSPTPNMMMQNGFPGINGMDMNAMAAMGNPMMLQEIMMNQMALMAQITGMMNGQQFAGGFPMMPQDMGMIQQNMTNGFQGGHQGGPPARGRGGTRGGRGIARGKGGPPSSVTHKDGVEVAPEPIPTSAATVAPEPVPPITPSTPVVAPTPIVPAPARPAYAIPERPQSPTLCKFGVKCTNAHCRWSHPSPVATIESGVVLSTDHCENGKDCKDKDCIKAHVSPAVLKPQAEQSAPPATTPHLPPTSNPVPCRFGAACTRPNCTFSHPSRPSSNPHFAQQCRFGAACTRATCQYQHPEGRVLPNSFHRGLSTSSPIVNVQVPETGTMGGAVSSPHKSVTFNSSSNAGLKEKLKELEERKLEAEKAVKEAEAAASNNKDSKPVVAAA